MSTYYNELRKWIREGELMQALESMNSALEIARHRQHNSAILQSASLNRNERDYRDGLITREQFELARAKASNAALAIVADMEKDQVPPPPGFPPRPGPIGPPPPPPPPPASDKLKILFLGANPLDSTRLRIDKELREIDMGLRMASERDHIVLAQRWAVNTSVLQQALLEEKPQIVHFSGHGTEEGIMLENSQGQSQLVPENALAKLFGLFADQIRCVVLNSCYSANQADSIARYIPFVIGMKSSMPDEAAIAFSLGFYRAIGAGRDIAFAFEFGVNAIDIESLPGGELPTLLKR
ncbi:MAG: CHAT domain-containing protein [Saprospiraceae bacterium]